MKDEKCGYGTKEDCDRPEQPNTAEREIAIARRNIAKAINNALDHGVGDQRIERIAILSEAIARIR